MNILIAGGGTGGHLYPGIALARALLTRFPDCRILFVGTEKGIEARILPREGFALKTIEVEGWIGKKKLSLVHALLRFPKSLAQSYGVLKTFRPDLVAGVGGYASGPVLLMSILLRTNRIILEQNVIPGFTNKILGYFVQRIFGSFEASAAYFPRKRFFYSGNPVRKEILSLSPGPKADVTFTILVFGGSQGARTINRAVGEALDILDKEDRFSLRWIHQTGLQDFKWTEEQYRTRNSPARVEPFIYDMAQAYGEADLVICRAGATTLAELTACGKPAILIPFPYAAHNHQVENARFLKKMGAAEMLDQNELSGNSLAGLVQQILLTPGKLSRMAEKSAKLGRKDAAEKIIEGCIESGLIHV